MQSGRKKVESDEKRVLIVRRIELDYNISKMWGAIDMSISGYTTAYRSIGLHILLMKN
jgi:hypothetical protein